MKQKIPQNCCPRVLVWAHPPAWEFQSCLVKEKKKTYVCGPKLSQESLQKSGQKQSRWRPIDESLGTKQTPRTQGEYLCKKTCLEGTSQEIPTLQSAECFPALLGPAGCGHWVPFLLLNPCPPLAVPTAAACTGCPGSRLSRVRLLLRWASTATVNSHFDMKPFKWKSSFAKLKWLVMKTWMMLMRFLFNFKSIVYSNSLIKGKRKNTGMPDFVVIIQMEETTSS